MKYENYNGTSWTELADLNSGRGNMYGFGSTTAAIGSGGTSYPFNPSNFATNATESWNGSAWTEVNEMTYGRASGGAATAGPSTAGLIFGGGYLSPSPNYTHVAYTESWDGTNWTEVADLNTPRGFGMGGAGTQTSALAFGGSPSPLILTESWNGSSWTEVADLNTTREGVGGSGATNTAAIAVGGNTPAPALTGATETWDGTSWTEGNDLATARSSVGSAGTSTVSLGFGGAIPGSSPTYSTATEEWAFGGLPPSTPAADYANAITGDFYYNSTTGQFKTVNAGVGSWASGGSLNTRRFGPAGTGTTSTQTAMLAMSGDRMPTEPRMVANVEQYDGSSFTEIADVNAARGQGCGAGTTTAALFFLGEGQPPSFTASAANESWDGSSWTEVGDLGQARTAAAGFGTSTSALASGGGPSYAITESWNGSSWTEVADLNTGGGRKGCGVSNSSGIVFGRSPSASGETETWNGSSWTTVAEMSTARANPAAFGTSTSAIAAGGTIAPGPVIANTEQWDGTSWTEVNDLATARNNSAPGGTATAGVIAGGFAPPGSPSYGLNATEEWTIPDFEIKSVTTS